MDSPQGINIVTTRTSPTGKCPDSLHFRACARRYRGQTTVEFALIVLPFFAILFAIVDYAQIFFYKNSLQNALRESARFATAGRIIQLTNASQPVYEIVNGVIVPQAISDGGREASRNECIRWWFQTNCVLKSINVTNITIFSAPTLSGVPPTLDGSGNLELADGTPANVGPGGQSDYVQIKAVYYLHTITPLFGYLGGYGREGANVYKVVVSAVTKNEPALLNFSHTNIYSDELQPPHPPWP